ncbi:hypothetical protein [Salisediminibacterium beveridgei]|nr:hypothetical protein [Salisediminibacterium beveridgei]
MAAGVLLELNLVASVEDAQQEILKFQPIALIQDEAKGVLASLYETRQSS